MIGDDTMYYILFPFKGHLIKHFDITDCEWHRIRMNIDSKCRTAFRRKQRGLPMTVKAFGYKTGNSDADQFLNERVSWSQILISGSLELQK